ncbi:MAG: alpha-amylase family glycosyl hydrolase [Rubricoccaceae bacterium]|nr:alpha-amylase family glycosyl hydrolase [Rubricoccaceae bacterium]
MTRRLILVLALLPLGATAQPAAPLPVVQPVRLTAGQADTLLIADLLGPVEAPVAFPGRAVVETAEGRALVLTGEQEGLDLVPFTVGGAAYALPVEVRVPTTHTFTFDPDLAALPDSLLDRVPDALFVIGAFNDWARGRDRLADEDGDGVYAVTLPIEPGIYQYKFTLDGVEIVDAANPDSVLNPFGAYNSVLTLYEEGGHAVLRPVGVLEDARGLRFALEYIDESGEPWVAPPEALEGVALLDNRPVAVRFGTGEEGHRTLDVPLARAEGLQTLRVAVEGAGVVAPWVAVPLWDGQPLGAAQAAGEAPFVWQDAIVYQIVIDRFADGDPSNTVPVAHDSLAVQANYQGGDLQGILDRLDEGYFTDLGVNVLWLSPVYDNPATAYREYPPPHRYYTGYHGYWPVRPRAVEERFGDLALLRRLVDAAHERGIKVLLDFVANHTHEDHPYVQEHRDWFGTLELPDGSLNLRRWDEYRLTTWFEPYLPSFDFEGAPAAVDAVTADAVWWLQETGADGFRHDAVKHIPNGFWRALTARLRDEVAPGRETPLYQIGETFGSYDLIASYVNAGQLDAQFNFNLYDAALAAFLDPAVPLATLAGEMDRTLDVYGPLHVMGNLMDSHDKPRFLALADGDLPPGSDAAEIGWTAPPVVDDPASYRRAELYLAYLLTTPGVPTIYYGDEVGMTGAADPDNRRMMRFDGLSDEQAALKQAVARLVGLRRDHAALRHGTLETLDAAEATWTFLRATPDDAVLVVLNTGDVATTRPLALPAAYGFTAATDLLTGEAVALEEGGGVRVPAGGYRILALDR